ncbi:MAG TPA: DUF1501 domain-containing protein [Pirellulales bacterium]|nr:DUF1501 domain-containing protein [Pirellulales bacterium]
MLTRRNLLKRSSLLALAPTVPGFLARLARAAEAKPDDRVLVVIQLDGGNDGVNTVVPYRDEGYAKHRNQLRLKQDQLHKLGDEAALHPAMKAMAELFDNGRLAIVQGVGYPNPNRSHDVSMAIWHTARFDRTEHKSYGWLGRALDQSPLPQGGPASLLVGDGALPIALVGRRSITGSFSRLDELKAPNDAARIEVACEPTDDDLEGFIRRLTLETYATADAVNAAVARQRAKSNYPASPLAEQLSTIARLIEADLPTRVYYAVQAGYDTHAVQLPTHGRLLSELSRALKAFLDDLSDSRLAERVLVMTFSEFGRRVAENASAGADHGTAAPMFLAGGSVRSGLHGVAPRLLDLDQGDLKMSVDFRRVYAAILRDWLALEPATVLAGSFEPLPILAAVAGDRRKNAAETPRN